LEISSAAKVGIITILAVVILALISFQLGHLQSTKNAITIKVVFDNVGDLIVGNSVKLQGMVIGTVNNIEIGQDNKVVVTCTITYKSIVDGTISLKRNSVFTIGGALVGDKCVDITPKEGPDLKDGEEVVGVNPITMDQLVNQGRTVLTELEDAVEKLNSIVGDPKTVSEFKDTMANFNQISRDMAKVSNNIDQQVAEIRGQLLLAVNNLNRVLGDVDSKVQTVGGNLEVASASVRQITSANQDDIRIIVKNLRATSHNLNLAMASLKELVTKTEFNENILSTLESLKNTGQEVEGIAADIHSLTSDPDIRADLKATVHEARQTVEGANQIIGSVKNTLGIRDGNDLQGSLLRLDTEVEWAARTGIASPNVNALLLPNAANSFRLGLDSLGYENLVNAQLAVGRGTLRPRGGVIRSQLGVGLDYYMGRAFDMSVDAYNVRNVRVDMLGRVRFAGDYYVSGGVRDAFGNSSTVVGVGKRF